MFGTSRKLSVRPKHLGEIFDLCQNLAQVEKAFRAGGIGLG